MMNSGLTMDRMPQQITLGFSVLLTLLLHAFIAGDEFGDALRILQEAKLLEGDAITTQIDGRGNYLEFTEEQSDCLEWIESSVKSRETDRLIAEIRPGFDRSLFGQIVIRKLASVPDGEESYAPVIAHVIATLREDPNKLKVLARSRLIYVNQESQVHLGRALATSLELSDVRIEWPQLTAADIQNLHDHATQRIGNTEDPDGVKRAVSILANLMTPSHSDETSEPVEILHSGSNLSDDDTGNESSGNEDKLETAPSSSSPIWPYLLVAGAIIGIAVVLLRKK